MLIQNGKLLLDGDFVYRDLRLEGDRIAEILPFGSEPREGEEVMDVYGSAITPGFIDLEVHGALGHDFSDGDREGYEIISKSLLRNGVTGYLAAVNAFPVDVLEDTYRALGDWMDDPAQNAARMLGVHMRGPFIAPDAAGCQDEACVQAPDLELFRRLNSLCGRRVKLLTMAPELPGANAFIRAILVNFTDERTIHPATLRMLFRGNLGRTCLVSGETAFAGLPNGTYEIERHRVTKTLNRAVFENGQDAGSVMGLSVLCKLIMSTSGVPLPLLFRSMTEIPARVLGVFDQVGSIEAGKRADLVMMDFHDYEVTHVFLSGKQVF